MRPTTSTDARTPDDVSTSCCAGPRGRLGPKRTSAAEERGTAMSLETAAEYLLLLTETGPPGDPAPDQTAEAPALPELERSGTGSW